MKGRLKVIFQTAFLPHDKGTEEGELSWWTVWARFLIIDDRV